MIAKKHGRASQRRERMPDDCVERRKGKKHKRKLTKETKRITCSFLAFWITMESYEVPFMETLTFLIKGHCFTTMPMRIQKPFSWLLEKKKKYCHHFLLSLLLFNTFVHQLCYLKSLQVSLIPRKKTVVKL